MHPGDRVRLRLAREELECTLLESTESGIVLVKLDSGYNIGIPKEHILGSEIVRSFKEDSVSGKTDFSVKTSSAEKLPLLGLIVTGGTIASKLDPKTGAASNLTDVSELARFYPSLFKMARLKVAVPFMKSSENMTCDDWIVIARQACEFLNDPEVRGVIITHGTDVIHYTSAALSFFLRDLKKPVVLTYSQRSIDRGSSDAKFNLECAARMALSDVAEVMLVGHAGMSDDFCYAHRGTKVRKMHSSRRDAFRSINCEPIARVFPDRIEVLSHYNARREGETLLDATFSDKVALLLFYPGQSPDLIDYYRMHGYKGIVIVMSGFGHVPAAESSHSWVPAIKKSIREGVVICGTTQTIQGRVNPHVYSIGRELEHAGVIFLEDMLSETAYVKLGWILGHRGWKEKAREKLLENVAGEFNTLIAE